MSLPPTTPPDPSEALRRTQQDPLLASAVRAADAARDTECPDADWLALYVEQELGASDRARVAPHLVSCERCQAIVAAYERASVGAPQEIPVFAAPEPEAGRGGLAGWLAGWRVLVPAASLVGVMVVAVWIGRGPADEVAESARKAEGLESTRQAQVADPAAPTEPRTADNFVAPRAAVGSVPPTPGNTRERARGLAQQAAPAQAVGGVARDTAAAPASRADAPFADAAPEARAKAVTPPPPVVRQEAATAEREAPAASVAEAVSAPPVLAPVASSDVAGGRPVPAPAAGAAAPAAPATPAVARRQSAVSGADDATEMFAVPPAAWRAREGAVERSRDNGTTWQRIATPAGVSVIAVASPSPAVCWAIAEHAVVRTTDGATFTHEPVPTSERLTVITASDAMNAVITTASGARFVTANGGRTWRRGQ